MQRAMATAQSYRLRRRKLPWRYSCPKSPHCVRQKGCCWPQCVLSAPREQDRDVPRGQLLQRPLLACLLAPNHQSRDNTQSVEGFAFK